MIGEEGKDIAVFVDHLVGRLARTVARAGFDTDQMRFVTSIGGVLYVHFTATITQANLIYLNLTFITIVMLLVGGMRSLTGAVVGVIAISIVSEGLRQVEKPIGVAGLGELGLAAFMLVVLAIRPGGIAGKREIPLPAFFRRTE